MNKQWINNESDYSCSSAKSMKAVAVAVFCIVISLVGGKFYLIALEKNQTDNLTKTNSYYTGKDDDDYDILAHENHDYQDCPMPFNPCHSGNYML